MYKRVSSSLRRVGCLGSATTQATVSRTSLRICRHDFPSSASVTPYQLNKEFEWRGLNWNLMRLFYEIVEHRGITAAARSMGRQQPATSQALSRLEQELGVALCRRGPGGFAVTPEGQIVFRTAAAMVELMRQASMALSQADGLVQGKLRIALETEIVSRAFDNVLTTLLCRHHLLGIMLNSGSAQDVLAAVRSGEADIGFCYSLAHDPSLVSDSVFVESHQIYCSPPHPLYGTTFDNPALLNEQSFFLLGNAEPVELSGFRRRFGLGGRVRGEAQSIAELKRLIRTGAAIGFLPNISVAEAIQVPVLWPLLRSAALPRCSMQMVTRPPDAISLPTQVFLDEVRRQFCGDKLAPAMSCSG